jgi:hypothetical protein
MKTSNFRFLVLVPHRDARLPLCAWSRSLFAAGFPGAWSFPWIAPLALLKRPLSAEELKRLAHALRRHCNNEGGKFIAGQPSLCAFPEKIIGSGDTFVLGPTLVTELGDDFYKQANDAISSHFSPLVLGSALILENESRTNLTPTPQAALPQISFRTAALANMSYKPLSECGIQSGYSFEWKIGKLHWLPKKI